MPSRRLKMCLALGTLLLAVGSADAAPPLLPAPPVVRRIVLSGPVDAALRERTERHLQQAIDSGANVLILELSCSGGDAATAHEIAHVLVGLSERPGSVLTIAYLTPQAGDTASLIALACDQIVLQSTAHFGGWEPYLRQHPHEEKDVAGWLTEIAASRGRPPLLARALVDHDLHLRLMHVGSATTFEAGDAANSADQVKPKSRRDPLALLQLDAVEAARYGIADKVDNDTAFYHWLGVDEAAVQLVQDDRLDRVGAFLRDYRTRLVLIALGLACLLLEIRFPRATVPAILATCCFALLFWSHSRLNPPATALALVLFGVGVVLLAVEVNIRPGYRACGVGGGVLLCISLGLLICGQYATGPVGRHEIALAVGQVAAGVLIAGGLAYVLTRYLPRLSAGARLLPSSSTNLPALPQAPAEGEKREKEDLDQAQWLGAIGETATPLEPMGVVRIGDDYVPAVVDDAVGLATGVGVQVVGWREGRVVVRVM